MGTVKRMLGLVAAMAMPAALADWEVNLPPGVTAISREVYGLHMLIFWICVAIGALVFGVMIYSLFAHRKSKNPTPDTSFTHSTKMEIVWTIVPILILVGMAYPSAKTLIAIEDSGQSDLTIKVTGYQWKWHYDYIDQDISFFSNLEREANRARQLGSGIDPNTVEHYLRDVDNRVVVPVDKKVRLLLTANDVIHAWWVPELGGKRDAIPGFVNKLWFRAEEPGVYRGQCAELCGRDHGFMPIVVEVKEQADYDAWVAEQTAVASTAGAAGASPVAAATRDWTRDELMTHGEEVYTLTCVACHQANGQGLPPTFPALSGSAVVTGDASGQIDVLLNGRPGTAMQAFGAQLDDADIAAVITYTRNALGNSVGDFVTPAEVRAAR